MTRDPENGEPEPAARPKRGRPATSSRDRIIATALQVVDEGGVQALSMRSLADHLGCSTATLYRNFPNRAVLIIDVIDLVMAEVALEPEDLSATWTQACRRLAHATFDALSRHHNVASLLAENPPIGPYAMALREHWVGVLLHHGFPPVLAADCTVLLARYTLGFATQLVAPRITDAQIVAELRGADPADFPAIAKAWANRKPRGLTDEFTFGLDRILDGLTLLQERESS